MSQGRLYRLAKRLSLGRFPRYLDLWARYGWRRGQSALSTRLRRQPAATASLAAELGSADVMAAKRMSVAPWFPLDLANARHDVLAILAGHPDIGKRVLYAQDAIEPNFLAGDQDSLALRPLDRAYYQTVGRHAAYSFQEDMGTWLAGSPGPTSFDRGARNTWRLLAEAAYPVRAYASHIPQIINKGLVNEIFDRFVIRPDGPAYDEWSLYFNVASQLYPRHFATKPYGTLGRPMRPDKPGLYVIRFCAALDSGAQLEARGLLTVVAGEGGS